MADVVKITEVLDRILELSEDCELMLHDAAIDHLRAIARIARMAKKELKGTNVGF
jgi:hypothetical protein